MLETLFQLNPKLLTAMKTSNIFRLAASLALSLLLGGCQCDDLFPERLSGHGATVAESRTVPAFSRVALDLDGTVFLTQGPTSSIRVEAQRNVLDVLKTDVSGGKLAIGFGRVSVRRHDPIRIYVTTPDLTGVGVSGAGEVRAREAWAVQDLDLSLAGSGTIRFDQLTARDLNTDVSGSGRVQLSGLARANSVGISGSGRVEAHDLSLQTADVNLSGSGTSYLTATQALRATISGSGKVYYKGRPAVTARVSGSGRVVDAN